MKTFLVISLMLTSSVFAGPIGPFKSAFDTCADAVKAKAAYELTLTLRKPIQASQISTAARAQFNWQAEGYENLRIKFVSTSTYHSGFVDVRYALAGDGRTFDCKPYGKFQIYQGHAP